MPTEARSEVEQIRKVQNDRGERVAPATNEAQGNWDGVTADDYITGSTNAEQLPAESIPDGVDVAVQAMNGNTGAVFVGDDTNQTIRLSPNNSIDLGVTDLSSVYIQTPNSGDGVAYIYEG